MSEAFGDFSTPNQAPQPQGRFNQLLHDPNAQAAALRVAHSAGKGALAAVGVENMDKFVREDGSIRKVRGTLAAANLARKVVTNPVGTATKVAKGAAHGAVKGGHNEVVSAASNYLSQGRAPQPAASPATPENSFTFGPSSADSQPQGFGPSESYAAPSAEPAAETGGRRFFRRNKDAAPAPSVTQQPETGFAFPAAAPQSEAGFTFAPSANYQPQGFDFSNPATGFPTSAGGNIPPQGFAPSSHEAFPDLSGRR
ncbi:MAG: hypothetical protein WDN27_03575 [Candidatus Saccharibacteria bacterium]